MTGHEPSSVLSNRAHRVTLETGRDRGAELRYQAEALAYRSALDHVRALRQIEAELLVASTAGSPASDAVQSVALDLIRTFMVRGLARAQAETGDRATYWVPLR